MGKRHKDWESNSQAVSSKEVYPYNSRRNDSDSYSRDTRDQEMTPLSKDTGVVGSDSEQEAKIEISQVNRRFESLMKEVKTLHKTLQKYNKMNSEKGYTSKEGSDARSCDNRSRLLSA